MNVDDDNELIFDTLIKQLENFGKITKDHRYQISSYLEEVKNNVKDCCLKYNNIPNTFNYFQTHHNALFLYKFSRTLFINNIDEGLCTKFYLLNRQLNGLDLYYKINMPNYFSIGHGLGTVLSNARYSEFLVIFQNSTVGVHDGAYPIIGPRVIIYPNSLIAGRTVIGENSVISAGCILIDEIIPANSVVFGNRKILIKENTKNPIKDYFNV